jgi:S1-C subfamily serine protease
MDETTASNSEPRPSRLHFLKRAVRSATPFVAGMFAVLLGLMAYNALVPPSPPVTLNEVNDTVAKALASATPPPAFSTEVYQAIHPSLVLIQTKSTDKNGEDENGLGSGVIIDDSGDILTSLHVVADATDIKLTFADGTQSSAEVTVKQPEIDIAVLSASQLPKQVVPATLGNPNAMRVGDQVFVVGNPFGLYSSMSAGVISGFDRSFNPPNSDQSLQGLIQIDAAVNPGNSGGPLLNRNGQVIGIVEGILNPTDQAVFIGIGFAVPINVAGGAAGLPPY